MGSKGLELGLCFVILMVSLSLSNGYKFYVGGKDGWTVNPSEGYNHWAERNRFQVNDTLYFRYKAGTDSVLVVRKDDYFSCNTKNPIKSLTEGDSLFVFDRSGPFFFISGNADNCIKGQKLIVVVLAVRNKTHHHGQPPAASPSPLLSPPTASPSPSPSPTVVTPPLSPSPVLPVPAVQPPAGSPGDKPSDIDAPIVSPVGHKSGSVQAASPFGMVLGMSMMCLVFSGRLVV